MKNNENDNISFYKILRKIIPIVFEASPIYFIVFNIISIMHGILYVLNIIMTQKFFDAILSVTNNKGTIKNVILMTIFLGLTLLISEIVNGIFNFLPDDLTYRVKGHMGSKINEKVGKLSAEAFENPSNLNDINNANEGLENSMFVIIILSSIFTFYIPYFVFMSLYLYSLKPLLAISLIIIFVPVILNQLIKTKVFSKLADDSAPIRREYEYYEKCIVDREYYKETRILGAFIYFKNLYLISSKLLNKKIWEAEKSSGFLEIVMRLLTLLGYILVLYLLVYELVKGNISIGAFGAIFASIGNMFKLMQEIICEHIGSISKNIGTIKNLVRFLDIPERTGEDFIIDSPPSILLKNVSFNYPYSNKLSICNINLKIYSGETIAIVGENGSGKTTLVKNIIGLYIPSDGKVIFGKQDTSNISMKSLFSNTSGVFQNFQKYKMNLGENISISNMKNINSFDKERLNYSIKKSGLSMDEGKLGISYETMLSSEFNGIDLSGGQWQKIAIARGFYRIHNTIVLDEPTVAIDPIEETKIYNKFVEMARGKTAIIVTHRLGAAKIADRIVVMDNGKICEIGTHDELMNINNKYASMYKSQSKWYLEQYNITKI